MIITFLTETSFTWVAAFFKEILNKLLAGLGIMDKVVLSSEEAAIRAGVQLVVVQYTGGGFIGLIVVPHVVSTRTLKVYVPGANGKVGCPIY